MIRIIDSGGCRALFLIPKATVFLMVDATNIACLETSVISTSLHCLRNYKFINYFIALVFYQSSENVQFSQHLIDNLTVSAFTQYKETLNDVITF